MQVFFNEGEKKTKENRGNYETQSDGQNISSPPMPIDESENSVECWSDYQNVMNDLGLEVLGEDESGRIVLYSKTSLKKTSLRSITQLKAEKLVQICGPVARKMTEAIGMEKIKNDIAEAAYSARRLSTESERRQGIWETADGSIAVVGADTLCLWDDRTLRQADSPIADGVYCDTTSAVWKVDFQQLKQDLEQFDREKAREVFRRLCEHLNHWIWVTDDLTRNVQITQIVARLFIATFIQTIWNWRPQASVSGESHSGKSNLFEFFRRILGNLSLLIEKPTPAGIRQNLRSSVSVPDVQEAKNGFAPA